MAGPAGRVAHRWRVSSPRSGRRARSWYIPPQALSPDPRNRRQNRPGRTDAGSLGHGWGTGGKEGRVSSGRRAGGRRRGREPWGRPVWVGGSCSNRQKARLRGTARAVSSWVHHGMNYEVKASFAILLILWLVTLQQGSTLPYLAKSLKRDWGTYKS